MKHETFEIPFDDDRSLVVRASSRTQVGIMCDAKIAASEWRNVRLLNLSPEGFHVWWPCPAEIDSKVWIRLPGLQALKAQVRWSEAGSVGCKFLQPLAPYVFEHIVTRTRAGATSTVGAFSQDERIPTVIPLNDYLVSSVSD